MVVRSLVAAAVILGWASSASAELVMVRVVGENVAVKSRPSRTAEVLALPQPDAILEVLSKEGGWFWVLIGRDSHGTQRAGWVRESDVAFVNDVNARYFPPPAPPPVAEETALVEEAIAAETAAVADAKPEEPVKVAKVEKPKKVDDRKLRKAQQEFEKALQAYEKLHFQVLASQPLSPVGEPIIEPLYSLQN